MGMLDAISPNFPDSITRLAFTELTRDGVLWEGARGPVIFKTFNLLAIATETTIWAPASGKKFRLMGGLVSMAGASGNILLKDNTGGATIFVIPGAQLATPIPWPPMGNGILSATANNVLTATGTTSQTLSGTIWGTEE